jgi:hypothetical protein
MRGSANERPTFFSKINPDRQKVIAQYVAAVRPQGDVSEGTRDLSRPMQHLPSAQGRRKRGGPDLAMVSGKSLEELLTGILDPNQAIEPPLYRVFCEHERR